MDDISWLSIYLLIAVFLLFTSTYFFVTHLFADSEEFRQSISNRYSEAETIFEEIITASRNFLQISPTENAVRSSFYVLYDRCKEIKDKLRLASQILPTAKRRTGKPSTDSSTVPTSSTSDDVSKEIVTLSLSRSVTTESRTTTNDALSHNINRRNLQENTLSSNTSSDKQTSASSEESNASTESKNTLCGSSDSCSCCGNDKGSYDICTTNTGTKVCAKSSSFPLFANIKTISKISVGTSTKTLDLINFKAKLDSLQFDVKEVKYKGKNNRKTKANDKVFEKLNEVLSDSILEKRSRDSSSLSDLSVYNPSKYSMSSRTSSKKVSINTENIQEDNSKRKPRQKDSFPSKNDVEIFDIQPGSHAPEDKFKFLNKRGTDSNDSDCCAKINADYADLLKRINKKMTESKKANKSRHSSDKYKSAGTSTLSVIKESDSQQCCDTVIKISVACSPITESETGPIAMKQSSIQPKPHKLSTSENKQRKSLKEPKMSAKIRESCNSLHLESDEWFAKDNLLGNAKSKCSETCMKNKTASHTNKKSDRKHSTKDKYSSERIKSQTSVTIINESKKHYSKSNATPLFSFLTQSLNESPSKRSSISKRDDESKRSQRASEKSKAEKKSILSATSSISISGIQNKTPSILKKVKESKTKERSSNLGNYDTISNKSKMSVISKHSSIIGSLRKYKKIPRTSKQHKRDMVPEKSEISIKSTISITRKGSKKSRDNHSSYRTRGKDNKKYDISPNISDEFVPSRTIATHKNKKSLSQKYSSSPDRQNKYRKSRHSADTQREASESFTKKIRKSREYDISPEQSASYIATSSESRIVNKSQSHKYPSRREKDYEKSKRGSGRSKQNISQGKCDLSVSSIRSDIKTKIRSHSYKYSSSPRKEKEYKKSSRTRGENSNSSTTKTRKSEQSRKHFHLVREREYRKSDGRTQPSKSLIYVSSRIKIRKSSHLSDNSITSKTKIRKIRPSSKQSSSPERQKEYRKSRQAEDYQDISAQKSNLSITSKTSRTRSRKRYDSHKRTSDPTRQKEYVKSTRSSHKSDISISTPISKTRIRSLSRKYSSSPTRKKEYKKSLRASDRHEYDITPKKSDASIISTTSRTRIRKERQSRKYSRSPGRKQEYRKSSRRSEFAYYDNSPNKSEISVTSKTKIKRSSSPDKHPPSTKRERRYKKSSHRSDLPDYGISPRKSEISIISTSKTRVRGKNVSSKQDRKEDYKTSSRRPDLYNDSPNISALSVNRSFSVADIRNKRSSRKYTSSLERREDHQKYDTPTDRHKYDISPRKSQISEGRSASRIEREISYKKSSRESDKYHRSPSESDIAVNINLGISRMKAKQSSRNYSPERIKETALRQIDYDILPDRSRTYISSRRRSLSPEKDYKKSSYRPDLSKYVIENKSEISLDENQIITNIRNEVTSSRHAPVSRHSRDYAKHKKSDSPTDRYSSSPTRDYKESSRSSNLPRHKSPTKSEFPLPSSQIPPGTCCPISDKSYTKSPSRPTRMENEDTYRRYSLDSKHSIEHKKSSYTSHKPKYRISSVKSRISVTRRLDSKKPELKYHTWKTQTEDQWGKVDATSQVTKTIPSQKYSSSSRKAHTPFTSRISLKSSISSKTFRLRRREENTQTSNYQTKIDAACSALTQSKTRPSSRKPSYDSEKRRSCTTKDITPCTSKKISRKHSSIFKRERDYKHSRHSNHKYKEQKYPCISCESLRSRASSEEQLLKSWKLSSQINTGQLHDTSIQTDRVSYKDTKCKGGLGSRKSSVSFKKVRLQSHENLPESKDTANSATRLVNRKCSITAKRTTNYAIPSRAPIKHTRRSSHDSCIELQCKPSEFAGPSRLQTRPCEYVDECGQSEEEMCHVCNLPIKPETKKSDRTCVAHESTSPARYEIETCVSVAHTQRNDAKNTNKGKGNKESRMCPSCMKQCSYDYSTSTQQKDETEVVLNPLKHEISCKGSLSRIESDTQLPTSTQRAARAENLKIENKILLDALNQQVQNLIQHARAISESMSEEDAKIDNCLKMKDEILNNMEQTSLPCLDECNDNQKSANNTTDEFMPADICINIEDCKVIPQNSIAGMLTLVNVECSNSNVQIVIENKKEENNIRTCSDNKTLSSNQGRVEDNKKGKKTRESKVDNKDVSSNKIDKNSNVRQEKNTETLSNNKAVHFATNTDTKDAAALSTKSKKDKDSLTDEQPEPESQIQVDNNAFIYTLSHVTDTSDNTQKSYYFPKCHIPSVFQSNYSLLCNTSEESDKKSLRIGDNKSELNNLYQNPSSTILHDSETDVPNINHLSISEVNEVARRLSRVRMYLRSRCAPKKISFRPRSKFLTRLLSYTPYCDSNTDRQNSPSFQQSINVYSVADNHSTRMGNMPKECAIETLFDNNLSDQIVLHKSEASSKSLLNSPVSKVRQKKISSKISRNYKKYLDYGFNDNNTSTQFPRTCNTSSLNRKIETQNSSLSNLELANNSQINTESIDKSLKSSLKDYSRKLSEVKRLFPKYYAVTFTNSGYEDMKQTYRYRFMRVRSSSRMNKHISNRYSVRSSSRGTTVAQSKNALNTCTVKSKMYIRPRVSLKYVYNKSRFFSNSTLDRSTIKSNETVQSNGTFSEEKFIPVQRNRIYRTKLPSSSVHTNINHLCNYATTSQPIKSNISLHLQDTEEHIYTPRTSAIMKRLERCCDLYNPPDWFAENANSSRTNSFSENKLCNYIASNTTAELSTYNDYQSSVSAQKYSYLESSQASTCFKSNTSTGREQEYYTQLKHCVKNANLKASSLEQDIHSGQNGTTTSFIERNAQTNNKVKFTSTKIVKVIKTTSKAKVSVQPRYGVRRVYYCPLNSTVLQNNNLTDTPARLTSPDSVYRYSQLSAQDIKYCHQEVKQPPSYFSTAV